jgi:hypothetical protein
MGSAAAQYVDAGEVAGLIAAAEDEYFSNFV